MTILVRRETPAGRDRRKSLRDFNPTSRTAIAVLAGRPTACIQAPSAPVHSVSQAWRKASLAAGTAIRARDKRDWQANHALHRHPNGPCRRKHLPGISGFINRRAWEMALASCAQECTGDTDIAAGSDEIRTWLQLFVLTRFRHAEPESTSLENALTSNG